MWWDTPCRERVRLRRREFAAARTCLVLFVKRENTAGVDGNRSFAPETGGRE